MSEAKQAPLPDLLDHVPEDIVLGIPGDEPMFSSYTNIPIGRLARQAAAELRRLHAECQHHKAWVAHITAENKSLEAQRDALLDALHHTAAIAHNGGLQGMNEWQALVAVRKLTLPYFVRSGSIAETHDRVRAAIKAAEEGK